MFLHIAVSSPFHKGKTSSSRSGRWWQGEPQTKSYRSMCFADTGEHASGFLHPQVRTRLAVTTRCAGQIVVINIRLSEEVLRGAVPFPMVDVGSSEGTTRHDRHSLYRLRRKRRIPVDHMIDGDLISNEIRDVTKLGWACFSTDVMDLICRVVNVTILSFPLTLSHVSLWHTIRQASPIIRRMSD